VGEAGGDDGGSGDATMPNDAAGGDAPSDATGDGGGAADGESLDAPIDAAPLFDGNATCTGANAACKVDSDAGAVDNGLCVANTCTPCTTGQDTLCTAAYGGDAGASHVCVNGSCVAGNCHTSADCAADGGTPACLDNSCIACDAVTGNSYYVDPTNGSDEPGATGSNMAGGQKASACAFKTITHALTVIGATPAAATKILVLGPSSLAATEKYPISVPTNVVIAGQGGTVTADVPATVAGTDGGTIPGEGFILAQPNSGLESLTISGTLAAAGVGVLVNTGSGATTYVKAITVQNFSAGDGIEVAGGEIDLRAGTTLTKNVDGLYVTGSGIASSTNIDTANPVAFTANMQDGVSVDTSGSVNFVGAAGTLGAGSIVASSNMVAGIFIDQAGPSGSMPTNTLNGVVAWQNAHFGLDLRGGSSVVVKNSYVGANATGVEIAGSASIPVSYDTSHIILGSSVATDPGKNTLQSPPGDAGASPKNTAVGVCFDIPASNASQILYAFGNTWADRMGTAVIDCTQATPGALSTAAACNGGIDLGGPNVKTNNANIGTANCTH
jgi:hypothetical protein